VSKFSKTGIFSGLNNLTDLTYGRQFRYHAGLHTGGTDEHCFSEKIDEAAQIMELSRDELLEEIADLVQRLPIRSSGREGV
jgi:hypothetical protein